MNKIDQQNIQVGEIANGLPLTIPVYRLKGDGSGKSVYIQANMHGAEVQGNAVIYQLLEQVNNQLLCKHQDLIFLDRSSLYSRYFVWILRWVF